MGVDLSICPECGCASMRQLGGVMLLPIKHGFPHTDFLRPPSGRSAQHARKSVRQ